MDPASIVGVAGVAINLAELVGKTIKLISEICDQWKGADLYFLSLCTQLGALKSALLSIQSWRDANPGSIHYLLEMELDSTMKCCRTLITEIDGSVRDVYNATTTGDLSLKGKAKFVLSSTSMEDVLRMVDRQTSSMTLLLTACNCSALARQKSLVEAHGTQKVLEQTKNDSASLLGLRDADSCCSRASTRFTQGSSKLSMVFDFDKELFSTRVYGLLHRATVKDSIRQKRDQIMGQSVKRPERTAQNGGRKINVLLLSNRTQCYEFYKSVVVEYGQPLNVHAAYAEIDVPLLLLQALRRLLEDAGEIGKPLLSKVEPSAEEYTYTGIMDQIKHYLLCIGTDDVLTQSVDIRSKHQRIVADMRAVVSRGGLSFQRMLAYDSRSIREYTFQRKENAAIYHFTDTTRLTPPMTRWLSSRPIEVLLYIADLETYDGGCIPVISATSMPDSSPGAVKTLVDDISDFAALGVQWGQVKILLLSNLTAFAAKLESSPFHWAYPDYDGDNSVDDVLCYIKGRFSTALWESDVACVRVADPLQFSHAQWFATCMREATVELALRQGGLA
ncbi:hypothetical protein NUW58_g9277 [Xylaria curta]|uniref:Uncharacterized protein n=1 Tax=Xylaria curta TaxID=42375 RepID=A0ACC1MZM4_9PEZI|nr:hypothetical protein NUW58_g9277 [Xylaria curta]